jgi:hypothetical protein
MAHYVTQKFSPCAVSTLMDGPRFDPAKGNAFFSSQKRPDRLWGPSRNRGFSEGIRRPRREADNPPPSSVTVQNKWSHTSTSLHGPYTDNCTCSPHSAMLRSVHPYLISWQSLIQSTNTSPAGRCCNTDQQTNVFRLLHNKNSFQQ